MFETIRVVNRIPLNLGYHNARLNRSRRALFGSGDTIDLRDVVRIPDNIGSGEIKCRVEYAEAIARVEFVAYRRKAITSLSLVECDAIEYAHKFVDRSCIESLVRSVTTDDILIVKHGRITDASFANVVFYDGTKWITPSTPLLFGTARARLLDDQTLVADEIKKTDLKLFREVALINAMLDLENTHRIDVHWIV